MKSTDDIVALALVDVRNETIEMCIEIVEQWNGPHSRPVKDVAEEIIKELKGLTVLI